jgi:hypothetical protein
MVAQANGFRATCRTLLEIRNKKQYLQVLSIKICNNNTTAITVTAAHHHHHHHQIQGRKTSSLEPNVR